MNTGSIYDNHGPRNAAIWRKRNAQQINAGLLEHWIVKLAERRNVSINAQPLRATIHAPTDHADTLPPWHVNYDPRNG